MRNVKSNMNNMNIFTGRNLFGLFGLLLFLFIQTNSFAQLNLGGPSDLIKLTSYTEYDAAYKASEIKVLVKAAVKEGWHINSNSPREDYLIASELGVNKPFELSKVVYPEAKDLKFDFSEELVSVYEGEVYFGALLRIPDSIDVGEHQLVFTLSYQACNNASCLAPNEVSDTLTINIVEQSQPIKEINTEIFNAANVTFEEPATVSGGSIADTLESSGIFFAILFVFLGGLALNLTPCVYPLIPITIGYFGGQAEGNTKRLTMLGVLYVLGMALTYSIVGVVTALSGAVFGTLLQNPIVIIFIALVFVVLSLSQFGVYEFKLPDSLVMKAGGAKSGGFGAFFMGLTMGIVAAPCIGPFVIGLVTYVAAKGDALYGFLMFFFLAVGLGTPYLFLAIFSGKIKSLPKAGDWMEGVKHIFGWILLAAAIYFLGPIIPKPYSTYALPVFMLIAALWLLFVDRMANQIKGFFYFKVIFSVIIIAVSVWMLIPEEKAAADWQKYTNEKFNTSIESGHKVVMDFYADWCIPCKELDKLTFSDERVIEKLSSFDLYKIDMTKTMSDETEKVRKKFNILGMPTIIIYNSSGKEVSRLTGFVNADEFLKILNKVK